MILLAKCEDGFGNPTFHDWFQYQDLKDFARALRKNYEINGQTAYATLIKAKKAKIILVSQLERDKVREMSLIPADFPEEGLSLAYKVLGNCPSTYILPQGGVTLPISAKLFLPGRD